MKHLFIMLGVAVFMVSCQAGETIKLPAPQKKGGPDVLTAIDLRASAGAGDFSSQKELSREEVSTLLWAASGLNRDGKKWTVPMGRGRPPYTKVYVTDRTGVYLYDWKNHALVTISNDSKAHGDIPSQAFAKTASVNMYMVPDMAQLSGDSFGEEWAVLLAGAMSQNVYLAAGALDVSARLVYSIDRDLAKKALGLEGGDKALFAIILGKR
jgi:nitroreductase